MQAVYEIRPDAVYVGDRVLPIRRWQDLTVCDWQVRDTQIEQEGRVERHRWPIGRRIHWWLILRRHRFPPYTVTIRDCAAYLIPGGYRSGILVEASATSVIGCVVVGTGLNARPGTWAIEVR